MKLQIEDIKEGIVKPIGTSAHVTVERKHLGKTAYILIVTEKKLNDTITLELKKGIEINKLT